MHAQPARVTLLLGADPQTLWPVLRHLSVIENMQPGTEPPWAWVLSADAGVPAAGATRSTVPDDVARLTSRALVLGAGCVCCSALVEFKTRVPVLLRQQRPLSVILQLGSGTHATRVIDLLASPEWNGLLRIDRIVWIPGRADATATADSAAAMRARMSWLAANVVVEVAPAVCAQALMSSLPPRPFGERPELIKLCNSPDVSSREAKLLKLFSTDQVAATHTSWNLRALSANHCVVNARWSRVSCFDRRAVLRLFEAYIKQDPDVSMAVALATERTWYEWHYSLGQSSWTDSEYRAQQQLIIKSDHSIEHVRRLEVLRDELFAIMIR